MAAFCARHGYSGRTAPEVLAGRLRASLLAAAHRETEGKEFTALMFAGQLELLNAQVRAVTSGSAPGSLLIPMRRSS